MKPVNETFKRVEKKYLLSAQQLDALWPVLTNNLTIDAHHWQTISNIYYDSPDYLMTRLSIDKPLYKEKLRLRCYGEASFGGTAYAELKKKYKGIVYKRRVEMPLGEAQRFLTAGVHLEPLSQVQQEIQATCRRYKARPFAFIAYDRLAFNGDEKEGLRLTIDRHVRCRNHHLSLTDGDSGEELLAPGQALMEIKTALAMPLYLSRALSEHKIFPTSFSKVGNYYERLMTNNTKGGAFAHAAS